MTFQNRCKTFLALLFLALLAACSKSGEAPVTTATANALSGQLTLTGSSTVAPLAAEIGKRFESLHPGVRVDVQTGGSSRGIADARRGSADIGMASRALKPDETDLAAHTIALDGISLIVQKDNPIRELDDAQVVAIYRGEIGNWKDVGGVDAPITVVNKAEGRSTLELFLAHYQLDNADIKASIVIGDNAQGILTAASNPHAIGYVSIGTAAFEAAQGTAIKLLPMAGIAPSLDTVRDGSFPLSRPLNLVTHGEVSPLGQAFIDFAMSPAVNDLIEAEYFVAIQH